MPPLAPSPRSQVAGSCRATAHQHLTQPAKGCGEYVFGVFSDASPTEATCLRGASWGTGRGGRAHQKGRVFQRRHGPYFLPRRNWLGNWLAHWISL